MANADKGKYVVLFNSGNFVFFKHKNDKGIFCPKSILNSSRQVVKDDIYELALESVTQRERRLHPDMPEAAIYIATRAKFVKTPRIIHGVGTMKKIAQDGEYAFVEYLDGRTPIQAFCTRITVKPTIQKGGMDKFFAVGCKVKFVAKEQPPSGMFNIEWRIIIATDTKHEIDPNNFERVFPVTASVPVAAVRAAAAPAAAAAAPPPTRPTPAAAAAARIAVATPPPGLPPMAASNGGGVSASSSSSSVVNGVSFAARAASQLPDTVAAAVHRANSGEMSARRQLGDENLPATAPNPHLFRLSDKEKENAPVVSCTTTTTSSNQNYSIFRDADFTPLPLQLRAANIQLQATDKDPIQSVYEMWPVYRKGTEGHLEPFEAQLSQFSYIANCLHGGDSHVCPVSFARPVS
ncbi:hypothetical protein PRIPAC_91633 [Pristionchus pacificus]|uniref:Uncharacterized protein n=1 Tax=Pristionchus pacificus TaxID=54126 RepID=A0A2A6CGZ9_PRIPA|nr:hypothetical protein PRIPAC_91633 [Pristionchus pacificus]|eukprot:PDM77494.1 hypothetical protein PRIPAC_34361 [Pristionchus pacificus]